MRHEWIISVLSDLQAYALKNDLPLLADRIAELLRVARAEIKAAEDPGAEGGRGGGPPPPAAH